MLRYQHGDLSAEAMTRLAQLQAKIDAKVSHADKYETAKDLFKNKNNNTFNEIKRVLEEMAPAGRCFYCELDRYHDIDHVRPKRHYPQHCFDWQNFVYACTICNQSEKRDIYAVFDSVNEIIRFDRHLPSGDPIPLGPDVLINPRAEDPLEFLQLDFESGRLVEIGDDIAKKRGKFTWELFKLNSSNLTRARKAAYREFLHFLQQHQKAINAHDLNAAQRVIEEIRCAPCPTVLVEIRRQAALFAELPPLLASLPTHIGARPAALGAPT